MADRDLTINPNQELLSGVLLRSTVDRGTIRSISIPRTDDEIIIVSAKDFGDANRITVLDTEFPVLASSEVSFKGQPVLAIFSYDNESSKLLSKEIKVDYERQESVRVELPVHTLGWGDTAAAMADEKLKKVTGLYYFGHQTSDSHSILKVKATISADEVLIECPTQWPFHVKRTVAQALGVPQEKVRVVIKDYYAPKDEYLTQPSILAAIAAIAARKGGCPAEIATTFPVYKPEMMINRTSAVDGDGNVVAEEVTASVDLGAWALFGDEIATQISCGLMPLYPVPNLSIKTGLFSTSKVPSNFFGTAGFADALCSSEVQASKVASACGESPVEWRIRHAQENPLYQKKVSTLGYPALAKCIREAADDSGFERKYFAFQLQRTKKNRLNSLLSYARGIGIACAPGVNGLAVSFKELPEYSVRLTLDAGGKVILNTSFPAGSSVNAIWSSIIAKRLKVSQDDISVEIPDTVHTVDSGPDLLSRDIGDIAQLIIQCCESINSRRFREPLPISAVSSFDTDSSLPELESTVWVAAAMEIEIDPVMIVPVVKKVWVDTNFSLVFDRKLLESKMRRVIESTIVELGGKPDPEMEDRIVFHIDNEGRASSVNQALKSALSASFTSALCQAINVEQIRLPISSSYLLEIIKGQNVK